MFHNILELSTGHMTHADSEMLLEETEFSCGNYEYGCYLHLPSDGNEGLERYSSSFMKVLAYARKRSCQFICFDCDANVLSSSELDRNEW